MGEIKPTVALSLVINRRRIIVGIIASIILTVVLVHFEVTIGYILLIISLLLFFSVIKITGTAKAKKIMMIGCLLFISFEVLWLMQNMLGATFIVTDLKYVVTGWGLCLLVLILFVIISGRIVMGIAIGGSLLLLLSTIDFFIMSFKGVEITPSDIVAIRTALNVANNYELVPDKNVIVSWSIFILLIAFISCCDFHAFQRKRVIKHVAAATTFLVVLIAVLLSGSKSARWSMDGTVYRTLVVNLALEFKESRVPMPKGYDVAALKDMTDAYSLEAPEEPPNIIVIMNESFADLNHLDNGMITDKEVIPFISSLSDNTIKGYACASVFGGSTANSEYEFLTGNSMAFLPTGNVPYLQLINSDTHSMVSELGEIGYICYAMHPYYSSGWDRQTVYPKLGFEEALYLDSFPQDRLIRGFVSDKTMYERMLSVLDNRNKRTPVFIFGVTMQNHGGWDSTEYESTVHLEGLKGNYPEAEQYLSLLNESDNAIKYFINRIKKSKERTIVVFFGDHLPALEEDFFNEICSFDVNSENIDTNMKKMEVPFFIWSNYEIESQDNILTSLNFLSTYVYKVAGIKTQYNSARVDISNIVPAINVYGYYSQAKGEFIPVEDAEGDEQEAINFYRELQYNNLFDSKNKLMMFSVKQRKDNN